MAPSNAQTSTNRSTKLIKTGLSINPKMLHYAFASSGLTCATLLLVAFLACDFLVPLSPTWSPERTAEHYAKHQKGIHAGSVLFMFSGAFLLPYAVIISDQIRRIPNVPWILPQLQFAAGIASTFGAFMPGMHLAVAGLRADRSPELIQLSNDTFWMYALMPFQTLILQSWTWSYAIIIDNRANPAYPKILALINLVIPAMSVFSIAVHATLSGPFAWNGPLGFWVPLLTFGLQYGADTFFLFRAIQRNDIETGEIEPSMIEGVHRR